MIAVTGASGHLGRLVVEDLLKRGTSANKIVAVVRSGAKAQDLAARGVVIREANYEQIETVEKALTGVERLLLVSGNEPGKRLPQHTNVVNAAKKVGVKFLAYTSILKADTSKMKLATEHLATEKVIQSAGIPYAILRNSWYIENYTEQFAGTLASGVIAGSTKNAKLSVATRADYASAAASVLLGEGQVNKIYELAGPALTLTEFASEVARAAGKAIVYKDMPEADYANLLKGFGVPGPFADILADCDVGIERGDLYTESRDLEQLIHRAPTSYSVVVQQAVKNLQ